MTTLAAYLHRIDPFVVEFTSGVGLRWYGLSYLAGFLVGYWLIRRVTRVGVSSLKPEKASDLVVTLAIGIVIGGRVGYVLFYEPSLLTQFDASFPFWGLLAIHRGGMASHGGMIGFILAAGWYARRHGHRWGYLMDLGAFAAPPGLFFGRVANFINGELYGRACAADFPLAVKFPQELAQQPPPAGMTRETVSLLLRAVERGDRFALQTIQPLLTPRHPSQIYQALLEGLVLFLLVGAVWIKPRKPLVVGASFCIGYGLVRIIGEFFREPDEQIAHLEFARWGVTRGQWLSILLALAGVVLLVIFSRRNAPRVGGWTKAAG